jgi:hypothetical protein
VLVRATPSGPTRGATRTRFARSKRPALRMHSAHRRADSNCAIPSCQHPANALLDRRARVCKCGRARPHRHAPPLHRGPTMASSGSSLRQFLKAASPAGVDFEAKYATAFEESGFALEDLVAAADTPDLDGQLSSIPGMLPGHSLRCVCRWREGGGSSGGAGPFLRWRRGARRARSAKGCLAVAPPAASRTSSARRRGEQPLPCQLELVRHRLSSDQGCRRPLCPI